MVMPQKGTPSGYSAPSRASGGGPGGVSPGQQSDWGAVWSGLVKRYGRLAVSFAALALLAAYQLTRPMAWAIVAIALLARIGGLGPLASQYMTQFFGG